MCKVINNAIKCVNILIFKGSTVWLFKRAILFEKVINYILFCRVNITQYVINEFSILLICSKDLYSIKK